MFFTLSTWTWDISLTLRGTLGFCVNHVCPLGPSLSYGVGWVVVAHKILVTSSGANFPFHFLDFGLGLGLGHGLVNYFNGRAGHLMGGPKVHDKTLSLTLIG